MPIVFKFGLLYSDSWNRRVVEGTRKWGNLKLELAPSVIRNLFSIVSVHACFICVANIFMKLNAILR